MADYFDSGTDLEARWSAARLAHAATALSRLQHDLRNMLAPAMLAAERLQASDVPSVKRAGDVTFRSAERANAAITATMALLRAGLPRPNRNAVRLAAAVADAAAATLPAGVVLRNRIESDPFVEATPGHLGAALSAAFAAVVAAGAGRLEIAIGQEQRRCVLAISHDGDQLPTADVPIDRFRWPHLAIAQEYVLAIEGAFVANGSSLRIELNAAPGAG